MNNTPDQPFAESAPYYRFRAPYAPAAIDYITDALALDRNSHALDLGCGPGTLAIPMSRRVGHIVAIDPCRAMIDEGRIRAAEAGCQNIDWRCLTAEDFSRAADGKFTVAMIGQAFHWMDRDVVLKELSRLLEPDRGALVLVNPGKRRPQESWEPTANEAIARYLGKPQRHAGMHPEAKHEPALLRSECFAEFTAREFPARVERDIRAIIGYIYSLSTSPRSAFGARASDFEQELTEALLLLNPAGIFHECVETEVVLARRGPESARSSKQQRFSERISCPLTDRNAELHE
jgi:ubiquinone/menaquinone biosynthesis C-methylase UbiE